MIPTVYVPSTMSRTPVHTRRPGITLVQMLLLIAGVATIVLLVVRQYEEASRKGTERELLNDLRNYTAAQEVYHSNHGEYAKGPGLLRGYLPVGGAIVEASMGTTSSWSIQLTHDDHPDLVCFASSAVPPACDERVPTVEAEPVNRPPVAVFRWLPEHPRPGDAIQLDARGSADPESVIMRYAWIIEDHPMYEEAVVNVTFPDPGAYTVRLRVYDDAGQSGQQSHEIVVHPDG